MQSTLRRRPIPSALVASFVALVLSISAFGRDDARAEALASLTEAEVAPADKAAAGRVLVLGFDGADWRKTASMMDAGELPNLSKLREMGTAGPLISTDPAESAAGWAAINTGANPAKNGVPSFVNRGIFGTEVSGQFAHIEQGKTYEIDPERDFGVKPPGTVDALIAKARSLPPYALTLLVFLAAFLLFKFVLRAHAVLALVIAAALGAAGWFVAAAPDAGSSLPRTVPGVIGNKVRLDGFWVDAAKAGHRSVALQAPMAFSRPGAEGARTLYGLGVPDVRSSANGDWFIYTNDTLATGRAPRGDSSASSSGTGFTYRVNFEVPEGGGEESFDSFIYGPVNFAEKDVLQREADRIRAIQSNPEEFKKLGFQESNALNTDLKELEKKIRRFDSRPYLHRVPAPLRVVKKADGSYDVTIDGETQNLKSGAWSESFYEVDFVLSEELSLNAITRARVLTEAPFQLYIDTLQFDPKSPAFWQPVSSPQEFSSELVDLIGSRFETLGWGCMTNQVKEKMVDPRVFLEDVEFTMAYRRRLMQKMLSQDDWSVLYSVFSATDRVQHMMYRHHDPEHPMHDPEAAKQEVKFFEEQIALADAIPAVYRQMDAIVGDALAALRPDDTLMLCADHGFTSYRRGMNVNNWLVEEGYLVLKEGLKSGDAARLSFVDWTKTRAYALGLGMVYLNLEGREPQGIVNMGDADALMAEICAKFLGARDGGRVVGTSAKVVKDVYQGPEPWGTAEYPCSDVMLGFAEFYRTSWATVDGSMDLDRVDGVTVAGAVYEDNDNFWSGDHASNDPTLVSGIFFCSQKVTSEDGTFSVMDIAPTVLDRLGMPMSAHFDRKPLKIQ